MARNVLLDAGFVVALLSRRDSHHHWAAAQTPRLAPPWSTCEAVLSEAFHLLGTPGGPHSVHCFAAVPCSSLSISPTNWSLS
jgi:predicted nucleic acid-binding protein